MLPCWTSILLKSSERSVNLIIQYTSLLSSIRSSKAASGYQSGCCHVGRHHPTACCQLATVKRVCKALCFLPKHFSIFKHMQAYKSDPSLLSSRASPLLFLIILRSHFYNPGCALIYTSAINMARTKRTRRRSRDRTYNVGLTKCKFPVQRTSDGSPIKVSKDIGFKSIIQCVESAPGYQGYYTGRGIETLDEILFITGKYFRLLLILFRSADHVL